MIVNKTQNINYDSLQTLQRQVYRRRGRRRQWNQKQSNKRIRTSQITNVEQQQLSTKSSATSVPTQPANKVIKVEQSRAMLPSTQLCISKEIYWKTKLQPANQCHSQHNIPTNFVSPQLLLATATTYLRQTIQNQNNQQLKNEVHEYGQNKYEQQDVIDEEEDDEEDEDEDVLLLRCIAPPPPPPLQQKTSCNVSCIRVGPTNVRVGRSKALCDVVLPPFPGLSRLHCVLSCVGDEISVHDRSSNGTFINGRCIGRNRCAMLHIHDLLTFIPFGAAHVEECTFTIDAASFSHCKNQKWCRICNDDDDDTSLLPQKSNVRIVSPSQPSQSLSSTIKTRRNVHQHNYTTLQTSSVIQVSKIKNKANFADNNQENNTALCPERFAKLVSLSQPPQCSSSVLLSVSSNPTMHEQVTTRYALGPVLGQGSFALVRLGVHHLTKAQVAIKLIDKRHFAKQNTAHAQLLMQAQIMMQIHHRHIVKVLDVYDGLDYIALVMELARQGDLFDYIVGRGKPPFTQREARLLFVQLLEALIYLHSQHLVHNDIKPQNVLVMSTRDTNEQTVTIDVVEQSSSQIPSTGENRKIENDANLNDSEVHSQNSSVCIIKTSEGNVYDNNENSQGGGKSKISNKTLGSEKQNVSDAFSVVDDHQFQAPCLSPLQVCLKLTDFGAAECNSNSNGEKEGTIVEVKTQQHVYKRRLWKAYTPMYTAPQNEDNADNDEEQKLQQNVSGQDQQQQQQSQQTQQMKDNKCKNGVQNSTKRNNISSVHKTNIQNTYAADIWSAGVLLYVMCTGVLPKRIYNRVEELSPSTTSATKSLANNAKFSEVQFTKHANHLSDLCKELIHGMLATDPAHRMTLHDICHHAWLQGMRMDAKQNV